MSGNESCQVEEYITGEGSLPVCAGLDDVNWDSSFFTQLNQENDPDEEEDEEGEEIEHSQKLRIYRDANMYLEVVHKFHEHEGHVQEALKLGSIIDKVSVKNRLP